MGKIVLVTVPIGNISDITLRALEYLKSGVYFFVEDTRSFKSLLNQYEISLENKMINSFHDQSVKGKLEKILNMALDHDIYLVSEAGSPYLSDPAYPLVKAAIEQGIEIQTTGGINSVTYALELSGFPANPFTFHGFIARDSGARKTALNSIFQKQGTHIFFEGVSRVNDFLKDLAEVNSDAQVVIARELSKNYESLYRFKAKDYSQVTSEMTLKGEFVILVHNEKAIMDTELFKLANEVLVSGAKTKTLAKLLSRLLNKSVKDIYAELGK